MLPPWEFLQLRNAAEVALTLPKGLSRQRLEQLGARRGNEVLRGVAVFDVASVKTDSVVLSEVVGWGFQGVLVTLLHAEPLGEMAT